MHSKIVPLAFLFAAIPLVAAPQVNIAEFSTPSFDSHPQGITVGSDGAVWFVETSTSDGQPAIGRVDINGVFKEYTLGLAVGSEPQQIVAGPDGNLYFTSYGNFIGQLTTAGVLTQFAIPNLGSNNAFPTGITVGHDGRIWFSLADPSVNAIGAVSTSGTFITPIAIPTASAIPTWLTLGPDNNIWFTEQNANQIGVVKPTGNSSAPYAITEYAVPSADSAPFAIVAGPYGNLWFTERNTSNIGVITTGGSVIHEYPTVTAGSTPLGITVGPDGALWFVEEAVNNIARITTGGAVTEYPLTTSGSGPYAIVEGPDHALWFTEDLASKIGRISELGFESFAQVPGALAQLSIGADGTVWGINSSQEIFTYNRDAACNSTSGGWTNIGGALTHLAVGSSSAVWGLNQQESIYQYDCATSSWVQVPGSLTQIAVGPDGDVWGLNYQSNIYHYSAQTKLFGQVLGQLTSIVVGSAGAVYGLNSAGSIYWYNPGLKGFVWVQGTIGFTQVAAGVDGDLWAVRGGVAYHYDVLHNTMDATSSGIDIAQVVVGSGPAVFALGPGPFASIYQWNATSQTWGQLGGNLSSMAVGANGAVWGINDSQQIFELLGAPERAYQTLNTIPGATIDQISIGVDGTVWGVSDFTVQFFNRGTQSFQTVPTPAGTYFAQVSVGAGNDVWATTGCPEVDVNPDGSCAVPGDVGIIYQYIAGPSPTWKLVPGELNLVEVGADGSVWGVNAAGFTFTYNFSNNSWTQIPGQLGTLSVGADGDVWGINGQLQVFHYSGGAWVNVPGSLSQMSVGDANHVWGINAPGEVYYYTNNASQPWAMIPGALLDEVWVAFDGAVWGVNSSNNLYRWNGSSFDLIGTNTTEVLLGNSTNVWATFVGSTNPSLPPTVSLWF